MSPNQGISGKGTDANRSVTPLRSIPETSQGRGLKKTAPESVSLCRGVDSKEISLSDFIEGEGFEALQLGRLA